MSPTYVRTLGHALLVETVLYATVLMDLLAHCVSPQTIVLAVLAKMADLVSTVWGPICVFVEKIFLESFVNYLLMTSWTAVTTQIPTTELVHHSQWYGWIVVIGSTLH